MQVTKEQKALANQVDLVDYLSSKGYTMVKRGSSYKIKVPKSEVRSGDMSSLSVFENRRGWKRWSNDTSGGDAISFLQMNMGMSFQEAVLELTGGQAAHAPQPIPHVTPKQEPVEDKPFTLPKPCEGKCSRLFAYLTKTRMIDPTIVTALLKEKKLYQDERNNVVFVGYDEQHQARFGCMRGTNTDHTFRGDCDGSDKRYSFSVDGSNKTKLYIFEAPIDLLSHATLANRIIGNERAWTVHNRLSLAGVSDVALEQYLKTHPDVNELHFYLDNDHAGRTAAAELCEKYAAKGFKTFDHCPNYKDLNEELIAHVTKKPPPSAVQSRGGVKR